MKRVICFHFPKPKQKIFNEMEKWLTFYVLNSNHLMNRHLIEYYLFEDTQM